MCGERRVPCCAWIIEVPMILASSSSTNRYSRLKTSSCPENERRLCSISPSRTPRSLGRLTVLRWAATACSPSKSSGKTSRTVKGMGAGSTVRRRTLHLPRGTGKRGGSRPQRKRRGDEAVGEVDEHAAERVEQRRRQPARRQEVAVVDDLDGRAADRGAARVLLDDPVEDVGQGDDGGRLHVVEEDDGAPAQRLQVLDDVGFDLGGVLELPVL